MDFHSNLGLSLFRRLTEDKLTFIGRNSEYMERVGRERVEDRFVKKKETLCTRMKVSNSEEGFSVGSSLHHWGSAHW